MARSRLSDKGKEKGKGKKQGKKEGKKARSTSSTAHHSPLTTLRAPATTSRLSGDRKRPKRSAPSTLQPPPLVDRLVLPTEIVAKIVSYLCCQKDRSTLAVCMRVSLQLNAIVAPRVYRYPYIRAGSTGRSLADIPRGGVKAVNRRSPLKIDNFRFIQTITFDVAALSRYIPTRFALGYSFPAIRIDFRNLKSRNTPKGAAVPCKHPYPSVRDARAVEKISSLASTRITLLSCPGIVLHDVVCSAPATVQEIVSVICPSSLHCQACGRYSDSWAWSHRPWRHRAMSRITVISRGPEERCPPGLATWLSARMHGLVLNYDIGEFTLVNMAEGIKDSLAARLEMYGVRHIVDFVSKEDYIASGDCAGVFTPQELDEWIAEDDGTGVGDVEENGLVV